MSSLQKEVKELVDLVKSGKPPALKDASGKPFKVVSGGKHYKILDSKGRTVRDDNGPLLISTSPSDFRWRDLAVTRLMRGGVLSKNPWLGKTEGKDPLAAGSDLEDREAAFEEREARRLSEAASNRNRQERSARLRARVEPLIIKIGGSWSKRGFATEFADAAYKFMESNPKRWASSSACKQSLKTLRQGNTLSNESAELWETFISALEQTDTPRKLYFEMVSAARGIPPRATGAPLAERHSVVAPDTDSKLVLPEVEIESPPPEPVFASRKVQPLREAHQRSGLVWRVEFTLDDFADAQRALGIVQGMGAMVPGANGHVDSAIEGLERLLIKIGEFRFYEMVGRREE